GGVERAEARAGRVEDVARRRQAAVAVAGEGEAIGAPERGRIRGVAAAEVGGDDPVVAEPRVEAAVALEPGNIEVIRAAAREDGVVASHGDVAQEGEGAEPTDYGDTVAVEAGITGAVREVAVNPPVPAAPADDDLPRRGDGNGC